MDADNSFYKELIKHRRLDLCPVVPESVMPVEAIGDWAWRKCLTMDNWNIPKAIIECKQLSKRVNSKNILGYLDWNSFMHGDFFRIAISCLGRQEINRRLKEYIEEDMT